MEKIYYSIGDIIDNKLLITDFYIKNRKYYNYKCLDCGNEDVLMDSNLNKGQRCNVCSGKKVLKGVNDLWTTHPHVAKLLKHKDIGYEISKGSHRKEIFICPDCGFEKEMKIDKITKRGFSCNKCGDKSPYPEKFMFNILEQLDLEFEVEKSFDWSKNIQHEDNILCGDKRYDFYIPSLNCIIETHGLQHYKNSPNYKRNLKEEQENDRLKEQLAKENGIEHYIVINCKNSEFEYVKESIINNKEFNNIFNLSNIDWIKCHEYSCNSLVKQACDLWNSGMKSSHDISKIMKINPNAIVTYLKKGVILGWCDYSPEYVRKLVGIKNTGLNHWMCRKVICLNTGEIFELIKYACEKYNIHVSCLTSCCRGKQFRAGILENGEFLQWQYYEEYLINPKPLLTNEELTRPTLRKKRLLQLNNNDNIKTTA